MKTFYSLLYVNLNVTLDEKVCIGLVMTDGKKFFFQFSTKKLNLITPLLSIEKKNFIKQYLKSLEKDIQTRETNTSSLLNPLSYVDQWAKEEYLTYLSNYANNIVSFSAPKTISLANTIEHFKLLFTKYVYTYEEVIHHTVDKKKLTSFKIKDQVSDRLYPQIKTRVNTNIILNASNFETILVPVNLDFIGSNEKPVLGQTLDFTKPIQQVQHDVTSYLSLTISVEEKEHKKGKYFVIGQEPDKKERTHTFWQNLRTSPIVDYIELDELEKITNYMEEHNVQPYFEENIK